MSLKRLSRTWLIRTLAAAMLSVFVASPPAACADDRPPNVILIIADDMAWSDYGFMGHPQIRTPRIDRLARESLVYRRGYVTSSLCSPSLASILTGQYPHQHRITSNDPPLPPGVTGAAARRDPRFLAARKEMIAAFDEMPSLPRLLGSKGYLSFQSGKWWGENYRRGGFTHGMTHGDPARGGRHGDAGLAIGRQGIKPISLFVDLARAKDAPFFVWYAPMMPHQPHNPPERLLAHYRDKAPSEQVARYWAMCEWFDETVGEVLDLLDKQKLSDNTVVIFLADNGWIQDPSADRYAPRSKQSQYEGGLRTPILVRWPGKVTPRTSEVPVSEVDIAPTVLAAAGLRPGPELEGVSLLDDRAVAARPAVFGEIFTHNAVSIHDPASSLRFRWVIAGDWKLIVAERRNEPNASIELFDLAHDPQESRNLAAAEPKKLEELLAKLQARWPTGRGDH